MTSTRLPDSLGLVSDGSHYAVVRYAIGVFCWLPAKALEAINRLLDSP